MSRPENWGLAQVLWTTQGDLALEGLSGDLVADISSSLKKQVAEPSGSPIEKKVEEAYLKIFTPTGKYRAGKDASAVVQLEERLEAARAERAAAIAKQREYEDASRRVEDLRATRTQAKRDAEAIAKELKEAGIRAESFRNLMSERNERAARASEEEAKYADLKRRIDDIANAREEIKKATGSLRKIENELPLHERIS